MTNLALSGVKNGQGNSPGTFGPNAIALDSVGNIYAADFSSKTLDEFSPTGNLLHSWPNTYVTQAGLTAAPDGTVLVADYGRFGVDRITDGVLKPTATFTLNAVPGIVGVFRPSGVTVTSTGTIFVDTDGANGGTNTPALGSLGRSGQFQILATGPTRKLKVFALR